MFNAPDDDSVYQFDPYDDPLAGGAAGETLSAQPLNWLTKVRWGVILAIVVLCIQVGSNLLGLGGALGMVLHLLALVSALLISFIPPDATRDERIGSWVIRVGLFAIVLGSIGAQFVAGGIKPPQPGQPIDIPAAVFIWIAVSGAGFVLMFGGEGWQLGCYALRGARSGLALACRIIGFGMAALFALIVGLLAANRDSLLDLLNRMQDENFDPNSVPAIWWVAMLSIFSGLFILGIARFVVLVKQLRMFNAAMR